MTQDDELLDLLLLSGRGDQNAFADLYRQTASRLFAVALRMLSRRDLAEETLQEAYVNIWHHARDYDASRGRVVTWMSSIVRYKAIDRLRRKTVQEDPLDERQWEAFDAHEPGPLDLALQGGDAAALDVCIEDLSEMQRRSIMLAFFQGLTHQELTQTLGKPLGTVKSWIRRGLQSLKQCLQK